MKKLMFALVAVMSLALLSCSKEKSYVINYVDHTTTFANVTVFEYSSGGNLLAKHEIKDIKNQAYEYISDASTDYVVIGVEGVVANKIIEWYCHDYFFLNEEETTTIDVSFTGMTTQESNPANPDDHISRYLYK